MIKSPLVFYVYSRFTKPLVKAGVYQIDNSLSVKEILAVLESGKQSQIVVSIPEGLTMRRIGELLESKDVIAKIGGNPDPRTVEYYTARPCAAFVHDAAEILEEYLLDNNYID